MANPWEPAESYFLGDVVRIGPSTVLFTGAEAFRTVFAPGNGFDKAREYEALDLLPNVPHLFSVRDGRRHAVMRRRIAKAVSLIRPGENSVLILPSVLERNCSGSRSAL